MQIHRVVVTDIGIIHRLMTGLPYWLGARKVWSFVEEVVTKVHMTSINGFFVVLY